MYQCIGHVIVLTLVLHHTQLYMATFFTRAVETINELRVSVRRLEEFLALPEPPAPFQVQPERPTSGTEESSETVLDSASRSDHPQAVAHGSDGPKVCYAGLQF